MNVVCQSCLDPEHYRGRYPMKCTGEFATGWRFECSVCGSYRFVTKDKVGGTLGSGARDDGRRGALGSGYGHGTATIRRYHPVK